MHPARRCKFFIYSFLYAYNEFYIFFIFRIIVFFIAYIKIINSMAYYDLQILLIIDSGFFMELLQLKYFKDAAELENFP